LLASSHTRARRRSTWVLSRLYSFVNASISLRRPRAFHCYNRWLRGLFFVLSPRPHPVQKFSMEINTRFVWRVFLPDCCLSQSLGYRLEVLRAARVIITGLQHLQHIQSPLRGVSDLTALCRSVQNCSAKRFPILCTSASRSVEYYHAAGCLSGSKSAREQVAFCITFS